MLKKFTVNTISKAISNIIVPKFEKYVEDRKNDISLQEKIDEIVDKIDDYELLVNGLVETLEPNFKDSITIGNYYFYYNTDANAYVFSGNKLDTAKGEVWSKNNLYSNWTHTNNIRTRITAIVATLAETSFDEMLKIVESQIDFNEFIVK